jgi:FAD/FMN-containing dehydrogenase
LADGHYIVGPAGLVVSREGLLTYECDMHTFYKGAPDAVALPQSAEQVAAIVLLPLFALVTRLFF